jgi:hypothetical protein
MRRIILVLLTFAIVLGVLSSVGLAAPEQAKERVLVMRIEGADLSKKDKSDLFAVIQAKLSKYPDKAIVQPAGTDIDDLMMEYECFDIDAECLSKLGKAQKADTIVYVQVDGNDNGFALITRAVRVRDSRVLHDKSEQLRSRADLAGRLDKVLSRVFGAPPVPKTTKGRLVIQSKVRAARIFVDGKYAGSGKIRLKKPEGSYAIRVAKDGYQDKLFTAEVTAGATTKKMVSLDPIAKEVASIAPVAPPPDPGSLEPDEWYQTWWFWTAVSVVAIGTTAAVAAAAAADDGNVQGGRVFVTINGADAWRDPAVRAAGGAQ